MKSDRNTLLWGTVIGIGLAVMAWQSTFQFPNSPFHGDWVGFALVTATVLFLTISAYTSLLKRLGYWLLLCGFLIVHFAVYKMFLASFIERLAPLQADALYGIVGGGEFLVFALIIAALYGTGPNLKHF